MSPRTQCDRSACTANSRSPVFHPDYRFADAAADAIENCTNRSPYPTLHLLRESSVEAAIESGIDTDAIYERNIETLQKLGDAGWRALWQDE